LVEEKILLSDYNIAVPQSPHTVFVDPRVQGVPDPEILLFKVFVMDRRHPVEPIHIVPLSSKLHISREPKNVDKLGTWELLRKPGKER